MRSSYIQSLLIAFMLFFGLSMPLSAQKLTVESMRLLSNDATARDEKYQRVDGNGNLAGLVKVQIALDDVKFDGGMLLDQKKWSASEYWVWMADGATKLTVVASGFLPLEVNFRDYDFKMLHSKNTYKLVVTVPTGVPQPQDDGMGYLAMKVEPSNANVVVDGVIKQPQENTSNEYMVLLSRGDHNYEVSAKGYASQSGTVTIGKDTKMMSVSLVASIAQLKVECPTSGAQVYVNEQLKGAAPWSGSLGPDTYRVEVRKDGYRSQTKTVTLSENATQTVTFEALSPITGNLNVAYSPIGSDVYVDGSKLGSTPGIFRNILVGSHKVEIRKDGYASASLTVTIRENQTADLSGSLTASADPIDNNNVTNNANIFNVSSNGNVQTFTVNGVSFNMIRVDGGTFQMGATKEQGDDAWDEEKPVHSVTLRDYMIGETEVTQELWEAVMGNNPSGFEGKPKNPVESVDWNDCQEFIKKLNEISGKQFRLPTEAEWEYAARGGKLSRGYKYSGSNNCDEVAWSYENSGEIQLSSDWDYAKVSDNNLEPHPVKMKKPNELGLYDMSGNVQEWCSDWCGDYSSNAQTNPKGPASGDGHVLRGGSWNYSNTCCRVSFRELRGPGIWYVMIGLRLVL